MPSNLAQEWSVQWPLPILAISMLVVLFMLRFVVPVDERGRVKTGIFFAGAYLVALMAFGLLGRPLPVGHDHDWLRLLALLLLSFAVVIVCSLLLFDVVLARRQIPRILQSLVQGIAYLVTATGL